LASGFSAKVYKLHHHNPVSLDLFTQIRADNEKKPNCPKSRLAQVPVEKQDYSAYILSSLPSFLIGVA